MSTVRRVARRLLTPVLKRPLLLGSRVLVGSHHKTGTVWFAAVFRALSASLGLTFRYQDDSDWSEWPAERRDERPDPGSRWDIFMSGHSRFAGLDDPGYRGVHLVRDPRDVIVSGAFYHQKSDEPWLHRPRDEFGGMTYQEKINSFSSFDDRLLFEMEHASYENVVDMNRFEEKRDPRFTLVRYEDMIVDYDLRRFEEMFDFLGFRHAAMGWCLVSAYRNSLFSGSVKTDHVRSGKTAQWRNHFKPAHTRRFEELFGGVLSRLGYED